MIQFLEQRFAGKSSFASSISMLVRLADSVQRKEVAHPVRLYSFASLHQQYMILWYSLDDICQTTS